MSLHYTSRYQSSSWGIFGRIGAGILLLAGLLAGVVWISGRFPAARDSSLTQGGEREPLFFEYTTTVEAGHVSAKGVANFPNGIILVGTLDKVGYGPIEVKEALVMNRLFTMAFGPELPVQPYLHDPHQALQTGTYRLSIEFDPAQQSPFAREALLRASLGAASTTPGSSGQGLDTAIIRVSETFSIGTAEEHLEAQARDRQEQQTIRRDVNGTLGALTNLWQRLSTRAQQERSKGSFSRDDLRANEWQVWSAQWLNDLTALGEKARLHEALAPALPLHALRAAVASLHKQLATMPDLYFEVLTNERSVTDRNLQRAEQIIRYALGDTAAQLGRPDIGPSRVHVEGAKPAVTVTSPQGNVRSGPGMSHEAIGQVRKDDVLDLLSEQGEWFQVQLGSGRSGWVHRNVASKHPHDGGAASEMKLMEGGRFAIEKGRLPELEPISLLSTPVDYIPRPTADEVKIYAEIELQLQDVHSRSLEEHTTAEQHILHRVSDAYGISPQLAWNTYLKVQGWEIKP